MVQIDSFLALILMCSVQEGQYGPLTGVRCLRVLVTVSHLRCHRCLKSLLIKRIALQHKQYLAVGSTSSNNSSPDNSPRIGLKKAKPACIQIWSLNPTAMSNTSSGNRGPGFMRCELVLCIDYGPAFELKWCPLPSHDDFEVGMFAGKRTFALRFNICSQQQPSSQPRKLGILAGTFGDGSLSVFAVPYPPDVGALSDASGPVFGRCCHMRDPPKLNLDIVKVSEPLLRIELPETSCWSLDWANSEVLAVGCTNGMYMRAMASVQLLTLRSGTVAVYNISEILSTGGRLFRTVNYSLLTHTPTLSYAPVTLLQCPSVSHSFVDMGSRADSLSRR